MMRTLRCVLLTISGLLAAGPGPGDWEGMVKEYVVGYESIRDPVPIAYPWVAKRLKTLFGIRGVGHVRVSYETDGKRTLGADIYYKAGEVHLIDHSKGWNLVTKGEDAYEWQSGEKQGIVTKTGKRDLMDYLLYLTDPSYIMTSLYHDALYEPDRFLPPKGAERGLIERRIKEPGKGFRAVFVSDDPAWLCGFESAAPEGGEPVRVFFSKPEALKEVPSDVFERLKGVEFKRSDLSIRRHMTYL